MANLVKCLIIHEKDKRTFKIHYFLREYLKALTKIYLLKKMYIPL